MSGFKVFCVSLLVIGAFLWGAVFATYSPCYGSLGGTVYKPPKR